MTEPHDAEPATPQPLVPESAPPAAPPSTSGWITSDEPPEAQPAEERATEPVQEPASDLAPADVIDVESTSPDESPSDVVASDVPTPAPDVAPLDPGPPAWPTSAEVSDDDHSSIDDPAIGLPGVVVTRRMGSVSAVLLALSSAVALLSVLALVATAAFVRITDLPGERRDEARADARDQALRTARDAARLLLAYDYRRLDQDFAAGLALTADPFKSEYARTTSKLVTDVAKKYQAVVRSEVVQAGAVEVTEDRVVALVFVNQTTTSTRVQGAKVDLSRVRMVLERRGGAWKVVDVDAL